MFYAQRKNILYSFLLSTIISLTFNAQPLDHLSAAEELIMELGQEQDRLQSVIKHLRKEIKVANQTIYALQQQNNINGREANVVVNELIDKNNSLQGHINSQQDKIVRLSNQITNLQNELYYAKADRSSLGNKANEVVNELMDKIDFLESEVKELRKDKNYLIGNCAILGSAVGDTQPLMDHILIIEAKLARAEGDLSAQMSALYNQEKECGILKSQNYNLRMNCEGLKERVQDLSREIASFVKTINNLKNEIDDLKNIIKGLRETIAIKNRHLREGGIDTQEFDVLSKENLDLKKQIRDLNTLHEKEKNFLENRIIEESNSSFNQGAVTGGILVGIIASIVIAGVVAR